MARPEVRVTVVYCAPGCEDVTEVTLPAPATVADAIGASGVLDRRPEFVVLTLTAPGLSYEPAPAGTARVACPPLASGRPREARSPLEAGWIEPRQFLTAIQLLRVRRTRSQRRSC